MAKDRKKGNARKGEGPLLKEQISMLQKYRLKQRLTIEALAKKIEVPAGTLQKTLDGFNIRRKTKKPILKFIKEVINPDLKEAYEESGKRIVKSAEGIGARKPTPLTDDAATIETLKHLILALKPQLLKLVENERLRKLLREKISQSDTAFAGSLLTMIQDEDSFKRWKQYSNINFEDFLRR